MSGSDADFPCNTDAYQMVKSVTVVIYIRGHTVENIVTHPEKQSLTVELDIDGKHCMKAWAFYGEVDPSTVKVDKGGVKVEITLQKTAQANWPRPLSEDANIKPLYAKWQTVKFEEEEDKGEGLDHFLQKIYRDATPEQRRAMNKSMLESKGTVLSTNWDEVGSKTVEPHPPSDNK